MRPAAGLGRAATVVVVCLALAACAGPGPRSHGSHSAPSPGSPLTGLHWRLQQVRGPAGVTRFPATVDGWLQIDGHGHASGSDGCATFHATTHLATSSIRLTDLTATANGCLADHGPRDVMRATVAQVLLGGRPAAVTRTGRRLEVSGDGYVLTYATGRPGQQPGTPSNTAGG